MPASLAEDHQAEQEALTGHMAPQLAAAWHLLDLSNLNATLPQFREAVQAIVDYYGRASAAAALEYFRNARRAAGVGGRADIPAAGPVKPQLIDQLVDEVVAPLRGPHPNEQDSQDVLDSAAQQLVWDYGRRQLIGGVAIDDQARGWARVPNADACSFCLMLALRAAGGDLYKSKRSASFPAHRRRANGSGGDCKCSVEPVFGVYEPTARVREAQALWKSSTKGLGGNDARNAFRRAVEGRTDPAAK
ncbi:hypothetical protein GCM10027053_51910 [Intrasporangium mesophilum]